MAMTELNDALCQIMRRKIMLIYLGNIFGVLSIKLDHQRHGMR